MRAAIETISRQKLTAEMDEEQQNSADWEGGYEALVKLAREAIAPVSG